MKKNRIISYKAKNIPTWFNGEYYPSEYEIVNLYRERDLAAKDFLKNELKWTHLTKFTTKWSRERKILWVTFDDEVIVKSL